MRDKIFIGLGVLAAITGFTSSVQAQPSIAYNSRTEATTLSGASLVGIQNRTAQNDSNKFFLGNSSASAANSAGTVGNVSTSTQNDSDVSNNDLNAQKTGILQISDNVQLVSNEPLYSPSSRVPGQENIPVSNIERTQVQLNP